MNRCLAVFAAISVLGVCGFIAYAVHTKLGDAEPLPPTPTNAFQSAQHVTFHTRLSNAEKQHVFDAPFAIVTSVKTMPENVRRAFAAITGEREFALANPGEKYQVTDVIVEHGLPFRRLVFAGVSGDTWFVHYEHGGRGHSYSVVVFHPDPKTGVRFVWGGVGSNRAGDLQDLRGLIAAGRFSDDLPYYW